MKPYAFLMVLALVACSGSQPEQTATAPAAPQATQQSPAPVPDPASVASTTQPVPGEASAAPSWDPEPAAELAESAADDEVVAASQAAPAKPAATGPRVFTNKDLSAYGRDPWVGSSRPPSSNSGAEDQYSEPEEQDAGPQMTKQEINQYKSQVQQEITALTTDLETLKKQAASLHNPFLPRVAGTEQDKAAEAGKDSKQRLEYVNGRIEESQKKLAEAKGRMEQLDAIKPVEPPPDPPQQ